MKDDFVKWVFYGFVFSKFQPELKQLMVYRFFYTSSTKKPKNIFFFSVFLFASCLMSFLQHLSVKPNNNLRKHSVIQLHYAL